MSVNFIAMEGVDGSGKSTVAKAVCETLAERGIKAVLTREPTDSWLGDVVRRSYKKETSPYTEAFLFMADRADHIVWIKNKISEGHLVVTDRYSDSTVAYQAALLSNELGGSMAEYRDWLLSVNASFILRPDLTFIFDIDPEISLQRLNNRNELTKFEKLEYLKKVRENYLAIAETEETKVIVDASKPLEEVIGEVLRILQSKMAP